MTQQHKPHFCHISIFFSSYFTRFVVFFLDFYLSKTIFCHSVSFRAETFLSRSIFVLILWRISYCFQVNTCTITYKQRMRSVSNVRRKFSPFISMASTFVLISYSYLISYLNYYKSYVEILFFL